MAGTTTTCTSLGGISRAARALGSFAALKGDVAKCVRLAKGPEGLLRCLRYAHGPGHMSPTARRRAGVKRNRKYSYSTSAYRRRKGKSARPRRTSRRKGRKGRRRGRKAA